MGHKNLLLTKKFWPSFWTQFFGAFNDNVFKNALIILIQYKAYSIAALPAESVVALCGGIFILPFFLFSATAGQLCDKYPKHQLMYYIKIWEVLVMGMGAYGFLSENFIILLVTLFLMGLQSTFFGPIKYAILPELLNKDELVEGNAFFEMGTFVAILLGTILGGLLIAIEDDGALWVSVSVIFFALLGVLFSRGVFKLTAQDPNILVSYGIFRPTLNILKMAKRKKSVFLAILGISWFWFLGAALLSMFPGYVKNYFNGNEHVVTLFLALFSVGVALGSVICEKLSRERLELGLVPFGTIGMSFFILDLFFLGSPIKSVEEISLWEFLNHPDAMRVMIDLFGLSVFSGFFTVPLYTFVQVESDDNERSRVIAALNVINALFMVGSAIILILLYALNLSMPQIFGIWAILNLIVSLYIYSVLPEFLLRFIAMILTRISYRLKVNGYENILEDKSAVLVCNHVSFVDWLIIAAGIKRPVRFVIYYKFMKIPVIRFLFKDAKVIAISSKKECEETYNQAMESISKALEENELICLFPEGEITKNGELSSFKPGIEKILKENPVPVIPMTLNGLWGSFFSRKYNQKALSRPSLLLRNWFRKVELNIYPPLREDVSAKALEDFIKERVKL